MTRQVIAAGAWWLMVCPVAVSQGLAVQQQQQHYIKLHCTV
jgi:hypothetical protein